MAEKYEITNSQMEQLFLKYQKLEAIGRMIYFTEAGDYCADTETFHQAQGDAVRNIAEGINDLLSEVRNSKVPGN